MKPLLPTKPLPCHRRCTISSPLSVHPLRRRDLPSVASHHQRSLSRASHSVAKHQIETLNRIAPPLLPPPRTGTVTPQRQSRGDRPYLREIASEPEKKEGKKRSRRHLGATSPRPHHASPCLAALAANVKLLLDFAWMDRQGESEFGIRVVEDFTACSGRCK
ncbi:hypothetical protein LR48_Vigan11g095500 [Vigna angularis]|uniref:Uncharacterized protein n=1 Tax=Phaseolus angularis TaxID=3914 RepID=A0A0L9VST1_PHAAN|nr:hypothetical protein LR48_Vigan11g095500 [Vigna angularis]